MRTTRVAALGAAMLSIAITTAACKKPEVAQATPDAGKAGAGGGGGGAAGDYKWAEIPGLFEPMAPAENPMSEAKVALGKQLFFDTRLGKDGKFSCESCHFHDKGWTDNLPFSTKADGSANTRNTPSLYNVAYLQHWYWDGRAPTLEKQVAAAWTGQMGANPEEVAKALNAIPGYADQFKAVFGGPATAENIPMALAAFVRTLRAGGSAWDKYEKGDKGAVPPEAVEGYKVFTSKGQCVLCHVPPLYTDGMFHNIGLEAGKEKPDPGRHKVSNEARDMSAFKTPSLRGVSKTGPYFHDASAATLEDAVRYMASGGKDDPNKDPRLKPSNLTDEEIKQVVAFLTALASTESFEKPKLP